MEKESAPADRRSALRVQLRTALQLRRDDAIIPAFTQDISRTGVSFYTDFEFGRLGDAIEFTIEFPPEITLSTSLKVLCKGVIVRLSQLPAKGFCIAAQINRYQFVNASAS